MSHQIDFDDSDEGKQVVDASGDTVGRVVSVEHGTAHVDPDPGLTEKISSKLGWGDSDEETYILQEANVAEITDDEVRLDRL